MDAFKTLTTTAAPLGIINLDTDQILPARYLKYPRVGDAYGNYMLHDLRFAADETEKPDFVLNQPAYRAAKILIGDMNFGCGSAREGAVYALYDYGIRCLIAPSFGDIFYNNSCKNGLLPIRLAAEDVAELRDLATRDPATRFTVDLERQTLAIAGRETLAFAIDPFRKMCLLAGLDDITLTLQHKDAIASFERRVFSERSWLKPSAPA